MGSIPETIWRRLALCYYWSAQNQIGTTNHRYGIALQEWCRTSRVLRAVFSNVRRIRVRRVPSLPTNLDLPRQILAAALDGRTLDRSVRDGHRTPCRYICDAVGGTVRHNNPGRASIRRAEAYARQGHGFPSPG